MRRFILTLLFLPLVSFSKQIEPSMLVVDQSTHRVVINRNENQQRPIASITKLMTALVALDHNKDLSVEYKMSKRQSSKIPTDRATLRDLLTIMLVHSDNGAAETIAENFNGGRESFIQAMNYKAYALGMKDTKFIDPSGLGMNVSTANEVAILITAALDNPTIKKTASIRKTMIEQQKGKRTKTVLLHNTNYNLMSEIPGITLSKTGYTRAAGWCLAVTTDNRLVVILGSHTKAERLKTAKRLLSPSS